MKKLSERLECDGIPRGIMDEIEALERDAARYRILRKLGAVPIVSMLTGESLPIEDAETKLDALCDARLEGK